MEKRGKKDIFVIEQELLNDFSVLIILNHDSKESVLKEFDKDEKKRLKKILRKKDFEQNKNGGASFITYLEKGYAVETVVLLFDNTTVPNILPIIVHEITHLMQYIRNKFWEGHDEDEFEAYMAALYFKLIYNRIKKNGDV